MRALFFPSWYPGARKPERAPFVHDHAAALAMQGLKVDVCYPITGIRASAGPTQGNLIEHFGTITALRRGATFHLGFVRRQLALARHATKAGKPDVVVAEVTLPAGLSGAIYSIRNHVPLVIIEHLSSASRFRSRLAPRLYRWTTSRADAVAFVSQAQADEFIGAGLVAPHVPVSVVHNVVRQPDHVNSEIPFRDRRGLIFVGHLNSERKDLQVVLSALADMPDGRSVELEVVGDGHLLPRYRDSARRVGLERVRFAGALPPSEVTARIARRRALVLPTRGESFGIAQIEAVLAGSYTITSDLPSIRATIGGLKAVLLIESLSDRQAWVKAMRYVLDPACPPPPTTEREVTARRFSHEAIGERLAACLDSAVMRSAGGRSA